MKKRHLSLVLKLNLLLTAVILIVSAVLVTISYRSFSKTAYVPYEETLDKAKAKISDNPEDLLADVPLFYRATQLTGYEVARTQSALAEDDEALSAFLDGYRVDEETKTVVPVESEAEAPSVGGKRGAGAETLRSRYSDFGTSVIYLGVSADIDRLKIVAEDENGGYVNILEAPGDYTAIRSWRLSGLGVRWEESEELETYLGQKEHEPFPLSGESGTELVRVEPAERDGLRIYVLYYCDITRTQEAQKAFLLRCLLFVGLMVVATLAISLLLLWLIAVKPLNKMTSDANALSTELGLATRIQADMLPSIYPAFPERKEFEIFASMTPAKEVGGDFYDFFLTDDDHLAVVMADVSGKGVPAALFMMIAKNVVQNVAMTGLSPAKVLESVNQQILAHNKEGMFVTVWLGILELSTGKLSAANAGHEYPVLKSPDGDFAVYKDKHSFVIGTMPGMKYKEYELQLEKGSKLFLYTDGVPEASDEKQSFFGIDRMIAALNSCEAGAPEEILAHVRGAVQDFVGEAEQFDDMTMLCLEYRGPGEADTVPEG